MQVGIITYWNSEDNYGQLLQCFALQRYLVKKGHAPFLIRYITKDPPDNLLEKAIRGFSYLFMYRSLIKKIMMKTVYRKKLQVQTALEKNHPRYFSEFRNQYLKMSGEIYDAESLERKPPYADVYVCGSDQVWSVPDERQFYLHFVGKGSRKFSYAASFGGLKSFRKKDVEAIRGYLNDFEFISIREADGVDMCRNMFGKPDAVLLPDPTFLLSAEDYVSLLHLEQLSSGKPYILLYLIGNNEISFDIRKVYLFAEERGLEVIYVATQGRIDNYQRSYPTIGNWIELIQNAEYVVTNSFHGMAFSLIFRKQFLIIPLSGKHKRMNARFKYLLQEVKLEKRIYDGDINRVTNVMDFSEFIQYNHRMNKVVECTFLRQLQKN